MLSSIIPSCCIHSSDRQNRPSVSLSRRHFLSSLLAIPLLPEVISAREFSYDAYAPSYDSLDGLNSLTSRLGFTDQRLRLLSHASGATLETAVGTGVNLPYYPSSVSSLTALDSSSGMLRLAQERSPQVEFIQGDVQEMPFANDTFDTIVDTFSVCVFDDGYQAIKEMKRVVKPGGKILLLEHCRGDGAVGWYQDLVGDGVKKLSKGCKWNVDVMGMVKEAGLNVKACERSWGGTIVSIQCVK